MRKRKHKDYTISFEWSFVKKRLHYAWFVCFGCALIFFCTCGLSCNVYSVYQPFLIRDYGFTQTQVGLMTTIRTLANMSSLLVLKKFFDRLNLRRGLLAAALINVAGYYVFSVAGTYRMFVLGHILVGFGYGLSCMVPMSMLLERWFYKDRTLAVSICCAASGLATVGVPGLITSSIERRGLNRTFFLEAVIMTAMVGLGALILRDDPKKMHISAFGEEEQPGFGQADEKKTSGLTMKELIPAFIMVFMMGAICGPGWSCMSLLASTQGYSSGIMALGVTLAGAALMAGKFLYGYLSEKFTIYKTTMWFFAALLAGGILLCVSGAGTWAILSGCLVYGGALSMITVGLVSWTGDWVSPENRNDLKRRIQITYSTGSLCFTVIPGIVADLTGSYVPSYIYFTVTGAVCMFIMRSVYRRLARKNRACEEAGK